jgi:hypothetical protein
MKVENGVDALSGEDSIDMKAHEVYTLSTFSINKAEPEVSFVFSFCLCVSTYK